MKKKLKRYKIKYFYDGEGTVIVKAKNEDEAEEKWRNGEYSNEEEWGDQYSVDKIEEI